jgi:hypothetical protein
MKTNRAGPELGFSREPASAVAAAIVAGIHSPAPLPVYQNWLPVDELTIHSEFLT